MAEWGINRGDHGSNDDALARGRTSSSVRSAAVSEATMTQISDAVASGAKDRDQVSEAMTASQTKA